ncbi:hypothetical protein PoB_000373600, partial [Plakobranchus ocellatus]
NLAVSDRVFLQLAGLPGPHGAAISSAMLEPISESVHRSFARPTILRAWHNAVNSCLSSAGVTQETRGTKGHRKNSLVSSTKNLNEIEIR